MPATVVVGAQWGDEGKGKLVDRLAEGADLVVRFQGGSNAGHTLVVEGQRHVLHLVPSGVLRPDVLCCIGPGVVVDPLELWGEISDLLKRGVGAVPERLAISGRAPIVLPWHRALDVAREKSRGKGAIGTTGRGIGPCYEDAVGRHGLTLQDLLDPDALPARLAAFAGEKNAMLRYHGADPIDPASAAPALAEVGKRLLPYLKDVPRIVFEAMAAQKNVLFEGAQGTLLDVLHGSLPYVTSSHTLSGAACTGTGVGPSGIGRVLGVTKAYSTRVGGGPFPTEDTGETGQWLRAKGQEFGATTGRPRRCGWLDLVALRYAARLNGLTGLAVTKLDVLSGLERIRVCNAYLLPDGECVTEMPVGVPFESMQPVYTELEGWGEIDGAVRRLRDLPEATRHYVDFLESQLGVPVEIVSVGADRDKTLVLRDPFA